MLACKGLRNVATDPDPIALRKGADRTVARISEWLLADAKEVETEEGIASATVISADDEEIDQVTAEAMGKAGKEGVITVEESNASGLEFGLIGGMSFDRDSLSSCFVTDPEHQEAALEKPYVLLVDSKVFDVKRLLPVLEKVM